jgi:type VI secretion system protein ImpH
VGRAVWDRQHRIRIRLGPLTLAQYEGFLPGARGLERLVASVLTYVGWEFRWDVRLCLRGAEVPRARLGSYGRLGWTTWLGPWRRDEDAADLVLDPEIQRAAQPRPEEVA